MDLRVTTTIDCPPERAWVYTLSTRTLNRLTWPLLGFEPIEAFPRIWADGGRYPVRLMALGAVPLGSHTIETRVTRFEPTRGEQTYCLRDNGSGDMASGWDHRMLIETATTDNGATRTRYTDDVSLDAGVLTPLLWLGAQVLYRYRQFRLRAILE